MYDPFASPPPPGMAAPGAAPQQQPPTPAPNNALAALYNRHLLNLTGGIPGIGGQFGNGGPVAVGQPIPGPNNLFPLNPGMGGPMQGQPDTKFPPNGAPDWRQNFMQARSGWRGARPTFDGAMPGDWRTQIGDWRQQRPIRADYRMGTVPPTGA